MPKKILLADDSITIQKVITITFASEDYAIIVVGDGDNAVKKAKELKPDLILADVAMPGKSGYEVCEAVKTDPALKHIPVMLLAGTFEPLNKNEAERVKADESIVKPFESQELIDKVAKLLAMAAPEVEEEIAELEPAEIALEPEPFEAPKVSPPAPPRVSPPPAPTPPRVSPPPAPKPPSYKAPELDIEPTTEALFGPSDDFLGMEEEPPPPPKAPAPTEGKASQPKEDIGIGEEGGFMDLDLSEEELKPKVATPLLAPPARPVAPPPPPRAATPAPPKVEASKPAVPFEPEPYSFAPPDEEKDAFTPAFEPEKAEPFELGEPGAVETVESFWAEPAPIPAPKVPETVKAPLLKPAPAPEIKPEVKVEAPSFALREAQASKVADVVQMAADKAEQRVKQGAAEMLKGIKEPKEKIDDAIFKITRTVIEEVAWEVVPALAEELLAAEIKKFKDAWAKAR